MSSVIRIGKHQFTNMTNLVLGKSMTVASLSSMTLDEDDVILTREWLERSRDWYRSDEAVEYEGQFAGWNGSDCAYSFVGGRVALSACIYALGLQPGDEVILPGYTCVVVPNAFHFAGVKTVYSDIELETYGLDIEVLTEKITSRTKAILLHHLYGLVCRDYEAIVSLARKHGLAVIEDCAQSTGAEFGGRKVGNLGDVAFYSSEQSKVFNTVQGGIATTNNKRLARRIEEFQDQAPYPEGHWIDRQLHTLLLNYYRFKHPQRWWRGDLAELWYGQKRLISTTREEEQGLRPAHYGLRMPAPVAAIGLNQLGKLDRYNEQRRRAAPKWDCWCEKGDYKKPLVVDGSLPVYLRYPVLVEPARKRNRRWALEELGVRPGVWFVSHLHPADRWIEGCPNADTAVERCINLPTLL
jgi:dTDP-4-amino-4,6-dideoxygalactose transaminase